MTLCVNCMEAYVDRPVVDIQSAMRRQSFESNLCMEASVSTWDSICDKCQQSMVWFSSTNPGMAKRYWDQLEEMKLVFDERHGDGYFERG